MRQPMNLEALNQVVKAVELLDPQHVISVSISRHNRPFVLLQPTALAELASLTGQQPSKWAATEFWRLSVNLGDLEYAAMVTPDELPLFGYPVEPLPPRERREVALQAS